MITRIASNLVAWVDLLLQEAFPPVLDTRVDGVSMEYHQRMNRKGVFRPLGETAGVTVVRIIEGQGAPPPPPRGTRASREQYRSTIASASL